MLQSTKFLKQIRQIIVKRLIQLMARFAEEDGEKFAELQRIYGSVIKLGAIENEPNREKLSALARFATNQKNTTSLDKVRICSSRTLITPAKLFLSSMSKTASRARSR